FVYQTKATDRLATLLQGSLGACIGDEGPLAYHAQMSTARREAVRTSFGTGRSRCMVTTTALGLGVNLPATQVLIRDTTFPGVGRLEASELLQMMGRAGRGEHQGRAAAIVRPSDGWNADELACALRDEQLPP